MAHKPVKETTAVNFDNLPAVARQAIDRRQPHEVADYIGINNKNRKHWDTPFYNKAEGEKVVSKGNAYIVWGRDRRDLTCTGFGGAGSYHCASIDLVVGRGASEAAKVDNNGAQIHVDPDFKVDAARIYISQKSDVDGYFGLGMTSSPWSGEDPPMAIGEARRTMGFTTQESPRSTIALKADTLRFISRENIMLVTRTDTRNSQGGKTDNSWTGNFGIDLVGMNQFNDLQPMVRGDHLVLCLADIVESIQSLRTLLDNYIEYNNGFNRKVMFHQHPPAIPYSTIFPSIQDTLPEGVDFTINSALNVEVPSQLQHSQECGSISNKYLKKDGGSRDDKKYILSIYNRNN